MILQSGSSGKYVSLMEKGLKYLGYNVVVDGSFGPLDKAAVVSFQNSHGLTPDGIVGPLTQAALADAVKGGSPSTPPVVTNPTTPPAPVSTGGPIHGVDIYHGDNVVSFPEMLAGGFDFVVMKASDGLSSDSAFVNRFAQAKAAGLIVGAYHFYEPGSNQAAQAAHFYGILQSVGFDHSVDFACFDFEHTGGGDMTSSDAANAIAFMNAFQSLAGHGIVLYASEGVAGEVGSAAWDQLSDHFFWEAEYGVSAPKIANPFIWQYSYNAHIPGLGNTGDANLFNGSVADMKAMIAKI